MLSVLSPRHLVPLAVTLSVLTGTPNAVRANTLLSPIWGIAPPPHVHGDGQREGPDSTTYLNHVAKLPYLGDPRRFQVQPAARTYNRPSLRFHPRSITGSTHFYVGTFKDNSAPYYDDGVYANNSLSYWTVPAGYTVYAPTMRPAGTDCLEVGTSHNSGTPFLYVYNFCGSGFSLEKNLTSSFQSTYERDLNQDGNLMYTAESVLNPARSDWQAFLYNYNTNTWELLFEAGGTYPSGETQEMWAMFEEYAPSTTSSCASILPVEEDNTQMYHYNSGGGSGWVPTTAAYNAYSGPFPTGNNCWNTTPGEYFFSWKAQFTNWLNHQ